MTSTRRTHAQWQHLLADWQQSELSVADWCRQHGVSTASFYQWRKKLLPSSPESETSPWQALPPVESTVAPEWQMELSLPGGAVLRIRQAH